MTAMMRQICKQTLTILLALHAILALATFARADGPPPFVTDPLTGVALEGFDPISYFTEDAPLPGKPDYEYDWHGVPWYFANAANRDVFIKLPEVYAPQFGGHATMALARGYLSDGNPQIYLLIAKRLYLFYSTGNRDAFLLSPGPAITDATKHWATMSGGSAARPAPAPAPAGTPAPSTAETTPAAE